MTYLGEYKRWECSVPGCKKVAEAYADSYPKGWALLRDANNAQIDLCCDHADRIKHLLEGRGP